MIDDEFPEPHMDIPPKIFNFEERGINWYKYKVDELNNLLRELEWAGSIPGSFCPYCNGWIKTGHYDNCKINNLLTSK